MVYVAASGGHKVYHSYWLVRNFLWWSILKSR